MYFYNFQVVTQEVPGEISLCFSICGCKLRCKGCHSSFLWKEKNGEKLTEDYYITLLKTYQPFATCVLFMGGEWHKEELIQLLKIAKTYNYQTCLYTGEDEISKEIANELTWIKTGKWIESLGGLESEKTNQKFTEIASSKKLNHLFLKN